MNGFEEMYEGRLNVYSLDMGERSNEELQGRYLMRGHPTIAILDADGDVTARYYGAQTAAALQPAIDAVLEK